VGFELKAGLFLRDPPFSFWAPNAEGSIDYPSQLHAPARTRAFVEFILAHFGKRKVGLASAPAAALEYA
jgi:hypothetical protein